MILDATPSAACETGPAADLVLALVLGHVLGHVLNLALGLADRPSVQAGTLAALQHLLAIIVRIVMPGLPIGRAPVVSARDTRPAWRG